MNDPSSWAEQLQNIGLAEFSEANREILSHIESSGVKPNDASVLQASVEALIKAVSIMIEENNKALLVEADQ